LKDGQAFSVANAQIEIAAPPPPSIRAAIVAIKGRHPNRTRSSPWPSDWIRVRRGLHKNQPAGAAARARVRLQSSMRRVDIEHRLIVPCWVAGLRREEIPIVLVSACPSHPLMLDPPPSTLPIFSSMNAFRSDRAGPQSSVAFGPRFQTTSPIPSHLAHRRLPPASSKHANVWILCQAARHPSQMS